MDKRKALLIRMNLRRDLTQFDKSETSTTAAQSQSQTQNPYSTYSTYWKTIDVEGIGLDGFGYTVTVTADGPPEQRRSKLGKHPNASNDVENNARRHSKSLSLQRPRNWLSDLSRRMGFRKSLVPSQQSFEITTRRSLQVVTEVAPRDSFEYSTRPIRFEPSSLRTTDTSSIGKPEVRIFDPLDLEPPTRARTLPVSIRAPVPRRSMSPDLISEQFSNPSRLAPVRGTTGVRTFFYDSDDESLN
jgi:hypothetical protein